MDMPYKHFNYMLINSITGSRIYAIYDGDNLTLKYWNRSREVMYKKSFDNEYSEKNYRITLHDFLSVIEQNFKMERAQFCTFSEHIMITFSYEETSFNICIPIINYSVLEYEEISDKLNELTKENKRLKENASLIIGYYCTADICSLLPIVFINPYKECDIQLLNCNDPIKTLYKWSEQIVITYIQDDLLTESFKFVNCRKLTFIDSYNLGMSSVIKYLPKSLKIIEFDSNNLFKEFLKNYDKSCKDLYKIILYHVSFDGLNEEYNISLLIDYGIKELEIENCEITNLNAIEKDIKIIYKCEQS